MKKNFLSKKDFDNRKIKFTKYNKKINKISIGSKNHVYNN